MRVALIPMRDFDAAKVRLAPVLSPAERHALARAMFTDVVSVCVSSRLFELVAVVSADQFVLAESASLGATPLREPAGLSGLNGSLNFGRNALLARGIDELLIVPADIPLVTAGDLRSVLDAVGSHVRAAAVARANDGGTNALALRPPDVIELHFGPRSADAHLAAARDAAADAVEVPAERLRFDVDTPADVAALQSLPAGAATRAWIAARKPASAG